MDKFITQYVEPLLEAPLAPDQKKDKLSLLQTDLKIFVTNFVKNEVATVNKQLAKKSRELFIMSSDNQSLKEAIQQSRSQLQSVKGQLSSVQQEKAKQKIMSDKQIAQLNRNIQNLDKEMKKEAARLKMEKEVMEESYKVKIKDLKNENQIQFNKAIDQQKRLQQEQAQTMKSQFQQEKNGIMKENNEKKRDIINKYQQKIAKLTGQYEDKLFLLGKQFQEYKKQAKDAKFNFQNKIAALENNITRLKAELAKEQEAHQKYVTLYNNTHSQLSEHQQKSLKEKQKVEAQLHQVRLNLLQQQKKYTTDIKNLNNLLVKTIQQKDDKFTDTVESMSTEFRIKIETLETTLVQEKEIAVTEVEIKRDKQNYDHELKYQALKEELDALNKKYLSVSSEYEEKMERVMQQNQDYIVSLNSRKEYELSVNGKNAEREFTALKNKYQLQIRAIYAQHAKQLQELAQKNNEQKIALANKLTTQYESMISDQKASNQIQIKQKLIEFDRKAKGFEAKLKDAEKKRNQLKVAGERVKMEMQMRVDSMVQLNEVYENEILAMTQKVQNSEREKQRIVNQYELKILILKNQMKTTKEEFEQRQVQFKSLLESKLNTKNLELNKILTRVKKETEALVAAHQKRVQALEKQYNELKRVLGQKTSLPQDIEALKIFHGAYLQKQKQLMAQKLKVQQLYRDLRAKDAIDKVFAQKGSKKIHNKNLSTVFPSTLISFKSNQL